MYDFKQVKIDSKSIAEVASLLSQVFTTTDKFTNEFIEWQYAKNPSGPIVGFNAYAGEELAGHYVTQPIQAQVKGETVKGLLSLNTATHPDHRGKKLFTELAKLTYEYAKDNGYKFVYGVANDNSTHGFIKKLGFQLVSPLITKIGFGKIKYKPTTIDYDFKRVWTREDLKWRLSNPSLKYYTNKNQIIVPTGKPGLNATIYNLEDHQRDLNTTTEKFKGLNILKLNVGLDDAIDWEKSVYFDVPKRFKSSPLNLIFRDLSNGETTIDPKKVKFEVIDFDGY
ncbi:MAG: GNAT family N-acetyltransferase [Psychroserpens sp.]|uniref:GNAT family N-acetyltransferase n=1 Tax=Psychroserpens sp. TaxID=2020870 RepID=UPI003CBC17D1